MSDDTRMYLLEDVYVSAGRTPHYIANQGTEWSFAPDLRFPLFGIFGHLRPLGNAPRAVNLWELDWRRAWGFLSEQYGQVAPAHSFEAWWTRSGVDRAGGWDRFMVPGPGSPTLAEVTAEVGAGDTPRPCAIQQKIRLRAGAHADYLQWFAETARPAVIETGWKPVKWLHALHSSFCMTIFAAPSWANVLDLADALPTPDPAWHCDVETVALQAWAGSEYLKPPR